MRDWTKTLSPASFKGTTFLIDKETLPKTGREIAVHQFVKSESHATEDMGRTPREIRVAGYFASDSADSDARAFVDLCSTPGPGTLVLPQLGSYQARCRTCQPAADKDEFGRIRVDLDFIEAGDADTPLNATPLGDRLASSALSGMPDAAQSQLAAYPSTPKSSGSTYYQASTIMPGVGG
jgi:prophage DNA circulation protein